MELDIDGSIVQFAFLNSYFITVPFASMLPRKLNIPSAFYSKAMMYIWQFVGFPPGRLINYLDLWVIFQSVVL